MSNVTSEKRFKSGDNLTDIKHSSKYQTKSRLKVERSLPRSEKSGEQGKVGHIVNERQI